MATVTIYRTDGTLEIVPDVDPTDTSYSDLPATDLSVAHVEIEP